MGGIAITTRARMNANALALFNREPGKSEIVQGDEAIEQVAGGIELYRKAPLSEIDLDFVRAFGQAAPNFQLVFVEEIIDELLAGVARNVISRIHQAQSRRRNDRLFERSFRMALREIQKIISVHAIAEGPPGEARHAADVAGGERNLEAIGRGVFQAIDRIGPKVMVFALFAVGDHWGTGFLETSDRVADGVVVDGVQGGVGMITELCDLIDQARRPRNTADWFGRNDHL